MKRAAVVVSLALAVLGLFRLRAHLATRAPRQVLGLWTATEVRTLEDELRFYYFHEGGKGLYRYGQAGHNNTSSFDWSVDGDKLTLVFRKTAEHATTRYQLGEEGGRRTLTIIDDPRSPYPPRGPIRYRFVPTSLDGSELAARLGEGGPLSIATQTDEAPASVVGRMWIEQRRYATGGMGFRMYQLSEHAPDGFARAWRLGWYHTGDYDDWSTETLAYREGAGALQLRFLLRDEEAATSAELRPVRDLRELTLSRDPRNFLHVGRFVDVGKSF